MIILKVPCLKKLTTSNLVAFLSNLFHHYDSALFGLLSPIMAPLFFPHQDKLSALIYTFMLIPLGTIAKPLGALYFGKLADRIGPSFALKKSLALSAIMTILIGLCPTSLTLGLWAPICLAAARLLQSFFSAGQTYSGLQMTLSNTDFKKRPLVGGLFDAYAIAGGLLASLLTSLVVKDVKTSGYWRYLFFLAALPYMLSYFVKAPVTRTHSTQNSSVKTMLMQHRKLFTTLVFTSGFTHLTYQIAFTFTCGFVPLASCFSQAKLLASNSYLLIFDMLMLPLFGFLAQKTGKEKMMQLSCLTFVMMIIPLFYGLVSSSFALVILSRVLIVLTGVAFASCYFSWAFSKIEGPDQNKLVFLSSSLGATLIGAPSSSICLKLYGLFKSPLAPALYLFMMGTLCAIFVTKGQKEDLQQNMQPL